MSQFKIFIVEDDPWYGELLEYHLSMNPDNEVQRFTTASACLSNLTAKPDLITVDYAMPEMNGAQLLKKIREQAPDIPVIVISGQDNISTAIEMLHEGAYDYFEKDDNTRERLWNAVLKIRENMELKSEIATLRNEVERKYAFENIIKGNSGPIRDVFALMQKASQSNINISVTGETGTGKELVAKAIHFNSSRSKKPFIAVNMAAIPRELVESELFGYEKGAFTGASGRKTGRFEEANKGTLFLDEIGDLDLSVQSKLLRVIQEKELVRLGGNEIIALDVRLIVATHKNLKEEVKRGNFREDLYYRIMGLPIELPPLRDREEDVVILANYFMEQFCRENRLEAKKFSRQAIDKLLGYTYPGNIRELKSIVELAIVISEHDEIRSEDIRFAGVNSENEIFMEETTLEQYKRKIIAHFLHKYDNNVLLVAKKLDIGKSTIYNMLQAREIGVQ